MRCTFPRDVGFSHDGKTIVWSYKKISKEYPTFKLPCGKCLDCRLEYSRMWAIRCMHEAQVHPDNIFATLTYSDEHLPSDGRLNYLDFQLFMKRLRKTVPGREVSYFVTGEYGDQTKRPHWHAIIFNYRPPKFLHSSSGEREIPNERPKYRTERGDQVWEAESFTALWGKGIAEYGSVTLESANYVARYAAKKLGHGKDDEHDYHPISKKSSKHAIGKKWLEKYHDDIFNFGTVQFEDYYSSSIPRYYVKWLQKNHPEKWRRYVTQTVEATRLSGIKRAFEEKQKWTEENMKRLDLGIHVFTPKPLEIREEITRYNFKKLQDYLKLK